MKHHTEVFYTVFVEERTSLDERVHDLLRDLHIALCERRRSRKADRRIRKHDPDAACAGDAQRREHPAGQDRKSVV